MSDRPKILPITSLTEIAERLANIERNQDLMMRMVRLMLTESGLRKEIIALDKEMEADNGSVPPDALGSTGQ